MKKAITAGLLLTLGLAAFAAEPFTASISNKFVQATLRLPDVNNGYYQGVRFDWAGSIVSLESGGHTYWGQWFPRKDPTRQDSITGPVEVFGPLNYTESKPGETFVKIGVGVLRHADDRPYQPGSRYDFVDHGKWSVRTGHDFVEYRHELSDPKSGYAYVYTKTVRLTPGKPQMTISHNLRNTGTKAINTDVYNHGFFMLDAQPTGRAVTVTFPFDIKGSRDMNGVAEVRGRQIVYLRELEDVVGPDGTPGAIPAAPGRGGPPGATATTPVEGFSQDPKDLDFAIENHKTGAGVRITGDRPLSHFNFWSIRKTIGAEPYIEVKADPGKETSWRLTYDFYSVPAESPQPGVKRGKN
jgi:hypothetical protein